MTDSFVNYLSYFVHYCDSSPYAVINESYLMRTGLSHDLQHSSQALLDSLLVHICGSCALVTLWPWFNLFGVFVVLDDGWSCETEKHVSQTRAPYIFNEPIVGREQRSHGSCPEALNSPVYESLCEREKEKVKVMRVTLGFILFVPV